MILYFKTRNCHDVKPESASDRCLFRPTTNAYSSDNICGRQRALDLCLFWPTTNIFSLMYMWAADDEPWSGRLRCFGGGRSVRAGLTSPAGWNLLPAWRWCRVGLRVCSGSPLSLPSYAWINAFRNKWREWGVGGRRGLNPCRPLRRCYAHSPRRDLTRLAITKIM